MSGLARALKIGGVVVCGLGVVGALWFVRQHRHVRPVSASEADATFTLLQARFDRQHPLVSMAIRRPPPDVPIERTPGPLRTFHTVIYDTRGGQQRLVHVTMPYALRGLFARHDGAFRWLGELTFLDDTEFDAEAITLSIADIERHGPGLLVDCRHPRTGGWFLTWVD